MKTPKIITVALIAATSQAISNEGQMASSELTVEQIMSQLNMEGSQYSFSFAEPLYMVVINKTTSSIGDFDDSITHKLSDEPLLKHQFSLTHRYNKTSSKPPLYTHYNHFVSSDVSYRTSISSYKYKTWFKKQDAQKPQIYPADQAIEIFSLRFSKSTMTTSVLFTKDISKYK